MLHQWITLGIAAALFASPSPKSSRQVEFKTQKVGDAVHWVPERLEVKPGEKLEIVLHHDLDGGFDFHGFNIPELKISEQIDRHQTKTIHASVPKSLKKGEYKIGCQFHPGHIGATLVVK